MRDGTLGGFSRPLLRSSERLLGAPSSFAGGGWQGSAQITVCLRSYWGNKIHKWELQIDNVSASSAWHAESGAFKASICFSMDKILGMQYVARFGKVESALRVGLAVCVQRTLAPV